MSDVNYLTYNATRFTRQLPFPESATFRKEDSYDISGSHAWTNADDWADQIVWHTEEAFKVTADGRLRLHLDVGIRNAGSGNVPGGYSFDLWRQRGSNLPVNKRAQIHSLLGNYTEADWFYAWEQDVEDGDIIFLILYLRSIFWCIYG